MVAKIFREASMRDWHRNVTVGSGRDEAWIYVQGFRQAADLIIEASPAQRIQHFTFYPAAFSYRHAIELALKQTIQKAVSYAAMLHESGELSPSSRHETQRRLEGLSKEHSLQSLLNRLAWLLEEVKCEPLPSETVDAIVELHNMDSDGQVFRYPIRSDGSSVFPTTKTFDIGRLSALGPVVDMLEGFADWFEEYTHNGYESLSELASSADWYYETGYGENDYEPIPYEHEGY